MRIPRVHVETELATGATIALGQSQSHYLQHVLRLKSGAAVILFNGREAVDYQARIEVDRRELKARIGAATPVVTESPLQSEIIHGLARPDHMDWMIQKTTELGLARLSIFNAERTQTPLKPAQLDKRLGHWRGVAISACEQCGRALLPAIEFHQNLDQAIAKVADSSWVLDFDGPALASSLQAPQSAISILLGPEGGLNPAEIDQALGAGFHKANLGPRVLRSETAAVSALAIAQSVLGDLS